ncbi:MAG: flagellin [Rickettsiales bacterium]|nr:flagellin [Pseudomonadota bacterium]MDA0967590.1 flagellin [Pseudomonadota bacterium]MDG4544381.1 flagellin [Rickettsiales bacterium]MDG4546511.1 flagellin [Rickettsiales bacterium]MDG4548653.1 flagellin [Rickettsiales bacterium]
MSIIQSYIASAVIASINNTTQNLNSSILNLAGGVKTNAGVADLSVGTILRNNSSTLTQANINAGQGKSLLETAKGGFDQVLDLLQDIKNLTVQAQDTSLTANQRANLNTEAQTLIDEINRLANNTSFNGKNLLNGTISGTATATTATGQATENYTLLDTTQYSFSGTVAAGELATSNTFAAVTSTNIGATAGSGTITFTDVTVTGDGVFTIGGGTVSFGNGATDKESLAANFVANARASTNADVRSFIYTDNLDGTVTVTSADLGTSGNLIDFQITNDSGGEITGVTFGSTNVISGAVDITDDGTVGTTRNDPTSATVDANLQGQLTDFTAALDTTGTYNAVTFTVDINGTTYTSQAVQLFGTGGFNSKGNTVKQDQVITFYNTSGPTDGSGVYTDNGFTLTVAASDITISGGTQTAFETDLTNTAQGFATQLTDNRINQSRDIVLAVDNDTGGDFDVASVSSNNTFAGIESFDAIGTNERKDIAFVGDQFGDDGRIGDIGSFAFNGATNTISVTINGEAYTSDISDNTANTGGIVDGAGSYNSTTKQLTVGAGTILVFHSAATNDGRQLRIDLSNLTDTTIELDGATNQATFTDDLDTLFGVSNNPSLSFQVGTSSTDTIGVSLGSVLTSDIFRDDAGTTQNIDISSIAGATEAQEVIDNAINTVLGELSTAQASITAFTSAITTNNIMITNFDAASSALLDTDYALESTLYAQYTLQLNSSISVLAQESKRLQNLLQLLSF